MAITETWCSSDMKDSEFIPNHFSVFVRIETPEVGAFCLPFQNP